MFFSQLPLNPHRRGTRELTASPQRMHAAVAACFPPDVADATRVLWRYDLVDSLRHNLFVVSEEPPSFEGLAEQAGWPETPNWRTSDYTRFLNSLKENQHWVFRLVANPTASVKQSDGTRGKRIPLVKVEQQIDWLLRKATESGFDIVSGGTGELNLKLSQRNSRVFDRRHGDTRQRVTLQVVRFDGVLRVTDAKALAKALTTGIGRAKAYGCGLMTLAADR